MIDLPAIDTTNMKQDVIEPFEWPGLFYGRLKYSANHSSNIVLVGYCVPCEQKISRTFKSIEEVKMFLRHLAEQSKKHVYSVHMAI